MMLISRIIRLQFLGAPHPHSLCDCSCFITIQEYSPHLTVSNPTLNTCSNPIKNPHGRGMGLEVFHAAPAHAAKFPVVFFGGYFFDIYLDSELLFSFRNNGILP